MHNIQAVILAAGKSTRFKTGKSKLLQKICGQEIILYGTKLLEDLHIPSTIVVGFQKEEVLDVLHAHMQTSFSVVVQEEQRGTGDAVRCTRSTWNAENILIINGDTPLLTSQIIQELYDKHVATKSAITFVTAAHPEPSESYGRVIQYDGKLMIVESNEFKDDPQEYCNINAGIYLIKRSFLEDNINKLDINNPKQEFYLTDLVKIAGQTNLKVETLLVPFDNVRGVNNFKELWAAEHIKRSELIHHWMLHGVRFNFPQNVHLDLNVSIGSGTEVGAGAQLRDGTQIGSDCIISEHCIIERSKIADRAIILPFTVITDSHIETCANVGPFAHIRNHSMLGSHATIGNFVEIKKSIIGSHTKAKHLSYLGDAQIGEQVNIGAGTITCNHNGARKNTTVIGNGAYIGSNNNLIAPINIGKNAYTAAGSTITEDVPADALAIARAHQVNKEQYAQKLREKNASISADDADQNAVSFIAAIKAAHDSSF